MLFQVTVRDSLGKPIGRSELERLTIEEEEYYQKTRVIDQRILQNAGKAAGDGLEEPVRWE